MWTSFRFSLAALLFVVSAASDVLPGQPFTVTVTTFEAQTVTMQLPAGVELVSTDGARTGDTLVWQPSHSPQTLHVTVRARAPGDLVFRATSGTQAASTRVRVCCVVSPRPQGAVYLAVIRR